MKHIRRIAAQSICLSSLSLLVACSGSSSDGTPGLSGANGTGSSSSSSGGSSSGASSSGGSSSGGSSSGGSSSGGSSSGGGGSGGGGSGGGSSGGSNSGGGGSGGSNSGGGGSSGSGGAAATGGSIATGGAATGGAKATGGAATSGAATGGSSNGCIVKLEGWATVNDGVNGTTGGGDVAATTVTTFADLKTAAQDSKPRVIIVKGTIKTTDGGGSAMSVASNKTIIGADKNATIYGGIVMSGVSNVIIRNLNIQGTWPNSGPDDTMASHDSHHIWYDHLTIWDSTDGSLDITNQSNYQTVSWCKFWYTSSSHPHRLASLNGSGGGDHPEDSRYLKTTYHHNWWSTNVNERMPRMMYGKLHAYNNYFNSTGNDYCIGVGSFGTALIQNNYFKDVRSPHTFMYDWHMVIVASGNVYDNTTGNKDTGTSGSQDMNDPALNAGVEDAAPFTPPYTYALETAANVPSIVQKCAGPQDWP